MWFNRKFYRYCTAIIAILLIIFLAGKINYVITPIRQFIATLFFPLLISGILYYLLRPAVNLVEKARIPRWISILLVFAASVAIITIVGTYMGSMVVQQGNELIRSIPSFAQQAVERITDILERQDAALVPVEQIKEQITSFATGIVPFVSKNLLSTISAVANAASILFLVPIILFYILKDDKKFPMQILKVVPDKYKQQIHTILSDVDTTLSGYITGQAIMATIVGVMMYIGFLVLGLKYPLILALFCMLTAFIPFIGSAMGVVPAALVGLASNGFLMLVKIVILTILVQQLEGNLISPQIVGKRMNIHPLTFIIALLVAASLSGFVGMLVIIPLYAAVKVIIIDAYKLFHLKEKHLPRP